jgi:hypothetical protein
LVCIQTVPCNEPAQHTVEHVVGAHARRHMGG